MRTYALSAPVEQFNEYVANGWMMIGMDKEDASRVDLSRVVQIPGDLEDKMCQINTLTKPVALQAARILRPLGRYRHSRFFDSVTLVQTGNQGNDEYSNTIESLRRMQLTAFAYDTFKAESIFLTRGTYTYALRLHTRLRGRDLETYVRWLLEIRNGLRKLRNASGFAKRDLPEDELPTNVDFWWDTTNDVMFSFDQNYMRRLPDHLKVSFSLMDGSYSAQAIQRAS
jgi:hypothetical protein